MDKSEIEQKFDEKFKEFAFNNKQHFGRMADRTAIANGAKDIISSIIIPAVLKEVMPEEKKTKDAFDGERIFGFNRCIDFFKQKAKERFGIEL